MPEISTLSTLLSAAQAYYKLENTTDTKGGTSLTNNNSVTFTAAKFNNGANFGSSNTNKSLTLASTPTSSNQLANVSYSFWVNILAAPGSGVTFQLFENSTTASSGMDPFLQYRNSSGTLQLRGGHVLSTTNPIHTYNVNLGTGTWYHVGLSVESTITSKIFLNGVQVSTTDGVGTHAGSSSGLAPFVIAANRDGDAGSYASLMIDDFVIIERVLTPAEWLSIFQEKGGLLAAFEI